MTKLSEQVAILTGTNTNKPRMKLILYYIQKLHIRTTAPIYLMIHLIVKKDFGHASSQKERTVLVLHHSRKARQSILLLNKSHVLLINSSNQYSQLKTYPIYHS